MEVSIKIKVEVSIAWWFKPYMYGVLAMCAITGREPDEAKVTAWCMKAVRAKINGKRINAHRES
ncbi:hypothetical protein [Glaciimonas sp. PCH181]|uniref:hypothetical protein n=1 Tax=Glaciimonas sp. PCH181 TaxID=2133943 RepID=UPI000D3D9990|nr:hypothetical protein [Glaciimonas sp. PCH181]PUA19597.1 hypothetical protein C7W93_07055 [Glaciimonas sp. PCH181]